MEIVLIDFSVLAWSEIQLVYSSFDEVWSQGDCVFCWSGAGEMAFQLVGLYQFHYPGYLMLYQQHPQPMCNISGQVLGNQWVVMSNVLSIMTFLKYIQDNCRYMIHSKHGYPTRERILNSDGSLMFSSLTSKMHQFYIEHRKHWWVFDAKSMFHPCFQCFSTFKPTMFRLLNINDH